MNNFGKIIGKAFLQYTKTADTKQDYTINVELDR